MAQPFLHPSSGVFYLRRRVPDELRPVLGREYKRSLKTRDPAEAKARHAVEWTRSEEAFSLARAQLASVQVLTKRDMQQLAARWFRQELEALEQSGNFRAWLPPASDATVVETLHGWEEHREYLTIRQAVAEDDETDWLSVMRPYLLQALRSVNVPPPGEGTDDYAELAEAFHSHLLRLSDIAKQRDDGDWTSKPDVLELEPLSLERQRSEVKAKTITEVFEAYKDDRLLNGDNRSTRASLADFEGTVTRFVQMFGDLPVTAITRSTVQEYRVKLATFPIKMPGASKLSANELIAKAQSEGLPTLSPATIRNRLRVLGAVLGFAVRMGWISENPVDASGVAKAAGVAAAKSKASRRRKDYNTAELGTIFRSALFAEEGWRPVRSDFGQALYWLPVLLYYTGARREELCQLRVSDVQTDDGITFLSILDTPDDDDGRTVKTQSSRRRVPLHPDLLALGFMDYHGTLPAGGQLFPSLQANHRGFYSTNIAKAWTKYLRNVVALDSSASPLHGFRHTFKTLSRQVGIPEDVHDAITGHSDGSVSREYGGMPLSRMLEELQRYPSAPGLLIPGAR
ncbi:site-specific integrase [Pseudomonas oryzihabitans]|uniref:site-specific integrase n=1 Tax=Pseudomonas oryzihabitans TaxID=47885 RepID=UPI001ED92C31|nr:site-specific integrase [Pseudomonas psychrotolerans]